jgi:hypothetical protein
MPKPITDTRHIYLKRRYLVLNILLVLFLLASTNYYTMQHAWDGVKSDLVKVNSCNERLTAKNIQLHTELNAAYAELENRQILVDWAAKFVAEKKQKGGK